MEFMSALQGIAAGWPPEKPDLPPDPYSMLCFTTGQALRSVLDESTKLVIEMGSFLGSSTRLILDAAPNAHVVAIDHWKGPASLHRPHQATIREKIATLFDTFVVNCWQYRGRLDMLKMDTMDGLKACAAAGLKPDVVFVDADHTFASVFNDVMGAIDRFPEAIIVGDDWLARAGKGELKRAVKTVARNKSRRLQVHGNGWIMTRPDVPAAVFRPRESDMGKRERLNLGSGNDYIEDRTNVDVHADRVDIRGDLRTVEFLPGSMEDVICIHAIEHINLESGQNLIARVFRWLRPGGVFTIETPCRDKCMKQVGGKRSAEAIKGMLGGRSHFKDAWRTLIAELADSAAKRTLLMDSVVGRTHDTMPYLRHLADSGCSPELAEIAFTDGEVHRCVWSTKDLIDVMRQVGFIASAHEPVFHGGRTLRDTRVVGHKPSTLH